MLCQRRYSSMAAGTRMLRGPSHEEGRRGRAATETRYEPRPWSSSWLRIEICGFSLIDALTQRRLPRSGPAKSSWPSSRFSSTCSTTGVSGSVGDGSYCAISKPQVGAEDNIVYQETCVDHCRLRMPKMSEKERKRHPFHLGQSGLDYESHCPTILASRLAAEIFSF